jgi:hypothetical protein
MLHEYFLFYGVILWVKQKEEKLISKKKIKMLSENLV